jgi:signal transduction histidine kinase/FixJ family two-component response regulator
MQYTQDKRYPSSVKRKVLIGFTLTFVAILLALGIAHFSFRDVMDTVDDLSAPNEKLVVLNQVFQEVTTLDQLQRAEAIKNPKKSYRTFLNQSHSLMSMVDSLSTMRWDSSQFIRISAMKEVLKNRDRVFFSYLRQKSEASSNTLLSKRIDTLSSIIGQKKIEVDTSVVTTQKKTITTYVRDSAGEEKKDDRFFITRLFSKKKTPRDPETTHIKVQEELSVSVDTLAIAKQNRALDEVEKIMRDLETDQRTQSNKLLRQELELIHANTLFMNQLLSILHEVENEELHKMRANDDHAATLMNASISRISLLLFIFFLGAAVVVYFIWIDISKSNYYKEQLEKARDEAEELSQIKQRFLANMSHEIRTPLQSIIGFAEQIKQQHTFDREAVDAIHSSSEHLLHIVNEVLDYSRIASGHFTLEKENFSLMAIVKEVEAAIRIQAERKRLTFLLELDHTADHLLRGDSFRLRQILYNLLGNAVKFTHKGYVKLMVKAIPNLDSVRCVFEISDTGIGIQADDLNKIFNQFEQANTMITRHYGGTGLGLTIVKSLVEAQGGSLQATSEAGQGSLFTVELIYPKAPGAVPAKAAAMKEVKAPVFKGKALVVDDDAMILKLSGLILNKHGITHVLYGEAEKLLNEKTDPSVTHILMDIRMPHINGIELCHALRKRYADTVTYVALTAHVLPEEREALLNQGFDAVLSKPFREQDLLQVLELREPFTLAARDQEQPGVNLSLVRQMTLGDENLFQSVIMQFIQDTGHDLALLDEKVKSREAPAIREIVHKLTGRIGQMGMQLLSEKLHRIEERMDQGEDLSVLLKDISSVRGETHDLVNAIKEMTVAHQPDHSI